MKNLIKSYRVHFAVLIAGVALLPCKGYAAEARLQQNDQYLEVNADKQKLLISVKDNKALKLQLEDIQFNYQSAREWQISKQGDDRIELTGIFAPSVEFYRTVQDDQTREVRLAISKVEGGFRMQANPEWGNQVTLTLKDLGSHIFGLTEGLQPDNRLSPDLRNAHIIVDVNAEEASIQENYASAHSAFFMSSLGYGAFFDTFSRGIYDIAINGQHRIHHDAKALDWYLFFGENGAQIHQAYFALIGKPKSVPAWALGPVGWRDQNDGGAEEVLADIEKLSQLQMPFTSWFIDRPYSDGTHGWSQMNFSNKFADPKDWISKIREHYGLEFMTWTTPAFFGATPFATHLDGDFSYIDVTDPKTTSAFKQTLIDRQLKVGVKGHKIDRADEAFPVYESWQDKTVLPAYRRNLYTYLMIKMHDEALRSVWEDDQVTFTRSAIHRSQPYLSAIWAGDPRTSWEGLQSNFANAARSSFMGFPVWGTDVGGYQGEGYIPEELYLRWLQAGSMTGLFEIKFDGAGGEGRDRMPWQYRVDVQQQIKDVLDDRMALLPYLYSLANNSSNTGTVMQPLAYRHLEDNNTYAIWDQFYVGDILVAPVFTPQNKRSVYLPEGQWRDFDDPAIRYRGGQRISVEAPLAKLPRFVRSNSLYVTGNLYRGNDRLWQEDAAKLLTIHAFPAVADSATHFDYVDMVDQNIRTLALERKGNTVTLSSPAVAYARNFELVLDNAPKMVQVNGEKAAATYDPDRKVLTLSINDEKDIQLVVTLR